MERDWKRIAVKLTDYFRRFGDQPWARRGAEAAQDWARLLNQTDVDPADISRLIVTLEAGASDGGSAWEELLISVKIWARSASGAQSKTE